MSKQTKAVIAAVLLAVTFSTAGCGGTTIKDTINEALKKQTNDLIDKLTSGIPL